MSLPARILIIGCSGSGKSTLARRLAPITGLPVIHLDAEFWQPGWTPMPRDQWNPKFERLLAGERWIMDGNFGSQQARTLPVADLVVWLDFPTWRCMMNVARRVITHAGRVRPDMADGCAERWDWAFMEWIWNFRTDSRPKIIERIAQAKAESKVVRLESHDEVEQFAKTMEQRCKSAKQ